MPPKDKAAKGKGGKNDKAKGEEGEAKQGGTFTEVERTFMELQLAEVNRKNARLLNLVSDYQNKNDELQTAYDKLDEDRADIIAFLKKQLAAKAEENIELKERVRGLEELREIETQQFKETVAKSQKHFKTMKDQLSSENKLLSGKLNTLEEFRAIKDDLMRKFENLEQAFEDQEMKYKRMLYDAEKKYIIGKDKLKKDMEARLLQLAQDFQDATELRIAASTHRVIRENIAINNELDKILQTQSKLAEQNEKYKENERSARVEKELAEEERDEAINKNVVQLKVINQLTTRFQDVQKERALYKKRNHEFDMLQAKIQKLSKENENLSLQVRILEQNLHARLTNQNKAFVESTKITTENNKLKKILKDAAFSVQAALKLDDWAATDKSRELMDRQVLLGHLLEIVMQYRDLQRADSNDTLASFSKIYEEGDLGFVPKPVGKKKVVTPILSTESKETLTKSPGAKRSTPTISSESSLGSLKTFPSIKILPKLSGKGITVSLPFSSRSSESASSAEVEEEEDEGKTDMEKQLAASKREIQKSIMKDLAAFGVSKISKIQQSQLLKSSIEEKGEVGLEIEEKEEEENVNFPDKEKGEGATKAEEESKVVREDAEEGEK